MTSNRNTKSLNKLTLVKAVFALAMVVFTARLVWLQVVDRSKFIAAADGQQNLAIEIQAKRGTIYDRNMRVLAQDIDSYTYYVVPENIKNKAEAARELSRITGQSGWLEKFNKHPRFLYVARKTSKEQEFQLKNTDIETLSRFVEPKRVYPSGNLALPLLGRVDVDNQGLSGLELQYDKNLSGNNGKAIFKRDGLGQCYLFNETPLVVPQPGNDIVCTIDLNFQQIVEQELIAAMQYNNAVHGIGLFMKVGTGEILACAVFDSLGQPSARNRAITDQYEPGSTFKLITTALALSSGKFKLDDNIYVENGAFKLGKHIICDDHKYNTLSVGDVLVHSSNIGVSKMALKLGDQQIYKAIKEAGFVNPLGIDFPGEASGYIQPPSWREHYLANISFGHGISATPLQIVAAYDAVANDGYLSRPYLGREIIYPDGSKKQLGKSCRMRQVFPSDLTGTLKSLLRQVVERGTAPKAQSEMVQIAGKTGTALKLSDDGSGYDHGKAMASFVGFFPVDDPIVVGLILFDEPSSRYGGENSAPVFKNIAERYYNLPEQLRNHYVDYDELPKPEPNAEFASAETGQEIVKEQEMTKVIDIAARFYNDPNTANLIPDFVGLTVKQSLKLAAMKGLQCNIEGFGIVQEQLPVAGEPIDTVAVINLRCITDELSN